MTSVYLSARFDRKLELQRYAEELTLLGIEVTSPWLISPTPELTNDAWRGLSALDKPTRRGRRFCFCSRA
jgi:hypothetical protein